MVQTIPKSISKNIDAKEIRSRYKKCLADFRDYCSAPGDSTPDTVHEVRISLKRMDALIALLRFNKEAPSPRKLKELKSLFKAAGKLRSVQVEFETITAYFKDDTMNTNYLHQLHEQKLRRSKEFNKYIESASSSLIRCVKTLKESVRGINKRQVLAYLNAGEKLQEKRLRRSIFREQELHLIRKDLKRFFLNLKVFGYDREKLEKLLDLLGQWHDRQVAFDHVLKAIYAGGMSAAESEPIRKIKSQIINDKEDLYERIVSYYTENMHSD